VRFLPSDEKPSSDPVSHGKNISAVRPDPQRPDLISCDVVKLFGFLFLMFSTNRDRS